MESEPRQSDLPSPSRGTAETVNTSPFDGTDRPQLSSFVSVLSAILLMDTLGAILWSSSNTPKLDRFDDPDRALDLMVSRTLEAQDGLELGPAWHQWVTAWTSGSNEAERDQAIQWYRELVATTGTPLEVRGWRQKPKGGRKESQKSFSFFASNL